MVTVSGLLFRQMSKLFNALPEHWIRSSPRSWRVNWNLGCRTDLSTASLNSCPGKSMKKLTKRVGPKIYSFALSWIGFWCLFQFYGQYNKVFCLYQREVNLSTRLWGVFYMVVQSGPYMNSFVFIHLYQCVFFSTSNAVWPWRSSWSSSSCWPWSAVRLTPPVRTLMTLPTPTGSGYTSPVNSSTLSSSSFQLFLILFWLCMTRYQYLVIYPYIFEAHLLTVC